MNKKILFLAILAVVLISPFVAMATGSTTLGDACQTIKAVRNIFEEVGAAIVIIGWIITGILYLTAGGGSGMETAKKALIGCVIGTAAIVLSVTAFQFVNTALNLSGTSLTECT